ncbi:hypothetical protein V492_06914, partial [Pseudogymnoascus sp. VKM F-4246]
MSFIIRASTKAAAVRRIAVPAQARCFSVSSRQFLKETAGDSPNQGEAYERSKQEQLRAKKEGKNEWDANLASASEENVQADRDPKKDIKEMQRDSKEKAEKEASSSSPDPTSTDADPPTHQPHPASPPDYPTHPQSESTVPAAVQYSPPTDPAAHPAPPAPRNGTHGSAGYRAGSGPSAHRSGRR